MIEGGGRGDEGSERWKRWRSRETRRGVGDVGAGLTCARKKSVRRKEMGLLGLLLLMVVRKKMGYVGGCWADVAKRDNSAGVAAEKRERG